MLKTRETTETISKIAKNIRDGISNKNGVDRELAIIIVGLQNNSQDDINRSLLILTRMGVFKDA